jgi:hypothetical protein
MNLLGGGNRSKQRLMGTLMAPVGGGGEKGGFGEEPTRPKPSAGGPSMSRPIVCAILDKDMSPLDDGNWHDDMDAEEDLGF